MGIIQMRNGERIDSRELKVLEPRWAKVGERLDSLADYIDVELVEACS